MTSRLSPRDLRASDHDRDRVISLLAEAAADGRLTHDELTDRVEIAHQARTLGELAELTIDLAPPSGQPLRLDGRRVVAGVFGRDERDGRWVVPDSLPVVAVFGEVVLDLRDALLQSSRTVVHATLLAGTLHVLLPDGVVVETTGTAVLTRRVSRTVRPAYRAAEVQAVVEVRTSGFGGRIRVTSPRRPRRLGGLRRGRTAVRGAGA